MVTNEIFDQSRFGILVCRGSVDFVSCGEVAPTEYPMSTLHGYQLKAGKPNEQGLCIYTLINVETKEEIKIDRRCTGEEAISAARRFVEREKQSKKRKAR